MNVFSGRASITSIEHLHATITTLRLLRGGRGEENECVLERARSGHRRQSVLVVMCTIALVIRSQSDSCINNALSSLYLAF